jgi:PDZ domain
MRIGTLWHRDCFVLAARQGEGARDSSTVLGNRVRTQRVGHSAFAEEAEESKMKKAAYGMGFLASVLFAAAIADAQSSGGGGAGGGGASSSGATGTAASGTSATGTSTTGSTGTSATGSSGVGASRPSNLVTGGAGSSSTTGTAAGRTGTGASAFQASPPGSAVTQPGLPGTRQTNPALQQGSTFDRRSGLNQQNTLNQTDFTQRSAIERQRLIDQQQSPTLRAQQGQLDQGQSRISNQQMIEQRAGLGEQQAAGRQDVSPDQSTLRGETGLRSQQTLAAGTAPGELGVFVSDGATRGVLVSRVVTGSAAANAGLQPGDIILGVGDQTITSPADLTRFVRAIRAGEVAQLQVLRGDAEFDVDATLLPFRGQSSSSYGVGYRGSESSASGDLSSRVRRLEEQLSMVMDELQTLRRDVVVLRGGSSESAGFDSRFGAGETRTGMETEYGQRSTRDGIGAGFEGSATRSELDRRSTQSGVSTDATQRGPVSGVDAQSDTRIDARSTQPGTEQRDSDATNGGRDSTNRGTTPPATDDDPLGLNTDTSSSATPPQSERPASGQQQEQQSESDSDQALPF